MKKKTYNIKRMYFDEHPSRTIKTGLTLEQAQAHCRSSETSSKTATSADAVKHTEEFGAWFDGYDEEKS